MKHSLPKLNLFVLFVLILVLPFGTMAQKKKILYLMGSTGVDTEITNRLSVNYEVTTLVMTATTVSEIKETSNVNYAKKFDAIYVSESVGGSSMPNGLLTLDVPVVNTKFLCLRPGNWGITDENAKKTDVANLSEAVITMNTATKSHKLSAGLTGDVKLVKDGTVSANNVYLNCVATPVDIVKIATLKGDDSRNVVFGVEPGKTIYCTNATYPMASTTKRVANIGLHVSCLTSLTEEALKLIDAAVGWVVESGSSVNELKNNNVSIVRVGLNTFRLDSGNAGTTQIMVYSSNGQLVQRASTNENNATINLMNQAKGLYIVKVTGVNLSASQRILVE